MTFIRINDYEKLGKLVYKDKWSDKAIIDEEISEWSTSKIKKLLREDEYFRKGIVNLIFYGQEIEIFTNALPDFELKKFNKDKFSFTSEAMIDSLIRYREKGSYSGKKGNNPEVLLEKILTKLNIEYERELDLTKLIEHEELRKRKIDFIIPNRKNPKVLIESSYLTTTSSGMGDKAKTENTVKTLIKKHYPEAKFIGFVDGIGWYVRKNDLQRIITAFDEVFTYSRIDLDRFKDFINKVMENNLPINT